ncbi:MAG: hypothetical protein ACM3PR_15390 [Bacteroidales bacterium]
MKVKVYEAPGIHQADAVRNPTFSKKMTPGFIQSVNSKPLHFTVTSSVDESFIVDWQLDGMHNAFGN